MSNMNMGQGPQASNRPGQMTAVMRAMAASTGPKVLRIGLVSGGRILEERIVKQRTTVTIGPSERSTFVVQAPNVPPSFKLFELIGPDYHLNFVDGMTGRVALATGISDIAALRGQAKRVGNVYQVKLTEEARGKIVIGDTTFLFQFVAPPPVQARPQLPLSVKGGVGSQIDWNLTTIAAFSLLLHFGLVFSFYSSGLFPWADPVYGTGDDDLVKLAMNQPEINTPPPDTAEPTPTATTADTSKPDDKPLDKPKQNPSPSSPNNADPAKIAGMTRDAAAINIAILGALGVGPASQNVLHDQSGATVNMNGMKDNGNAVQGSNPNGLEMGRTGPAATGTGSDLTHLQGGPGGTPGDGVGPTTRVAVGVVQGGHGVASVPVQNADSVINGGLFPRARACYQAGLKDDPNQQGRIVISIQVSPSGDVSGASVAQNSGLSAKVASCIVGGARNLHFVAPGGAGSTITVPMNFIHQ
jgi:hypothetical protein